MMGELTVRQRLVDDAGTSAIELTILAAPLLALLALIISFGRTASANSHVDGAAFSAARAASIQRSAPAAQAQASDTAANYLNQRGLNCSPQNVAVDTVGFSAAVGERGHVEVSLRCTVSLQEVTGILPIGSRTFTASAVSPIDSYRGDQ